MYNSILLAVDINDPEGAKKPAAVALAQAKAAPGAAVHIVNVVPDIGMALVGSFFTADHNGQILAEAREGLKTWAADILSELPGTTLHIDQGTVYDKILDEAERVSADLIVVGAHRSQLKDYLIGPNAARIARHATCSVMVVR